MAWGHGNTEVGRGRETEAVSQGQAWDGFVASASQKLVGLGLIIQPHVPPLGRSADLPQAFLLPVSGR